VTRSRGVGAGLADSDEILTYFAFPSWLSDAYESEDGDLRGRRAEARAENAELNFPF